VVDDLTLPGRYPEIAAELDADRDTANLYGRLTALDPESAARMEPTNRRRIIRALEVCLGSGQPFSSFGPGLDTYPPTRFDLVGLWMPRTVVANRIAARYQEQLDAGFLEEVRALAGRSRPLSRTATQALGYRELLAHEQGDLTLDEAVSVAISRTRKFARRQRVWFRRDPRITWIGAAEDPLVTVPALVRHAGALWG
jgi:tRNA dimethylallyltransferase